MASRLRRALQFFSLPVEGQPFQVSASVSIVWDDLVGVFEPIRLPSDTLYVIEYVSGRFDLPAGQRIQAMTSIPHTRTSEAQPVYFPATRTTNFGSGGQDLWVVSQSTRLYAEGARSPLDVSIELRVVRDRTELDAFFEIVLSGYILTTLKPRKGGVLAFRRRAGGGRG